MRKTVHQTMKRFLPPSGRLTRKRQENRILAGGLLSSPAAKFASAFVQEQWGDRRNKQIPVRPPLFAPPRNIVKKAAMRTAPLWESLLLPRQPNWFFEVGFGFIGHGDRHSFTLNENHCWYPAPLPWQHRPTDLLYETHNYFRGLSMSLPDPGYL